MTPALILAAIAAAVWLAIVAWACIVTSGNAQPETPIGTRREDGQP